MPRISIFGRETSLMNRRSARITAIENRLDDADSRDAECGQQR